MLSTLAARSGPVFVLTLLAASPAVAHPGPHHETTLSESLAHVVSSADHMAALTVAALCAIGAIAARISWSRTRLERTKAPARSTRS